MSNKITYNLTQLDLKSHSSEELLSGYFNSEILLRLCSIIECEAPIYESVLKKRLLNSFDLKKCGVRLNSFLEPLITSLSYPNTIEKQERVFFRDNSQYLYYRATPESIRYSYQIPFIEGANAIKEIIANNKKLTKAKLLTLFSTEFEYKRKGQQVVNFFNESYNYYKKHN